MKKGLFFKKVNYSNKKSRLDIYSIAEIILAFKFIDEELTYENENFSEKVLSHFFNKAIDWSYEKEIRCVLSENEEKTPGFIWDDNQFFLKMKITKIYVGSKASFDSLKDIIELAKNRNIPVVFMKEDSANFKIIPDFEKVIDTGIPSIYELNCIEILIKEMRRALNFECYICAISIALTIIGIIGSALYPDLSYKSAFIKWYQENIGIFEKSSDCTEQPYMSGELCYSLKEAIQNKGNLNVGGQYKDFLLTDFVLRIEKEKNIGIYINLSSCGSHSDGKKFSRYELNVRRFCYELENYLNKVIGEHKGIFDSLAKINLRDFTEEHNRLIECSIFMEKMNSNK